MFNSGRDWLVITPEGLFDGTPEARRMVAYRVGETLNVQPVEAFFQDFYYPGLLGAIWKGERPMPSVKVKEQLPPEILVVSPKSGETTEGKVRFEVVVKDQGGGIQKPTITVNGVGVGVKEKPVTSEKEVRWSFDLPLANGENQVVIRSATADGQIACESQPVTLHYAQALENPPRLFVLTVGVSDYSAGSTFDLQCAAADAQALAGAFETNGKRFYGEEGVFVKTLTEQEVTKEKIQSAVQEIAGKARPEDVFVFSLAGHGSTVGQLYYYYPVDFPFEEDHQPVDSVIRENGIGGDILNDWINSVPAMKRIVIYDTCQSEAALKRSAMEERKAMELLSKMTGCFTIAAASGKEAALELPDMGHGVLTYALLGGLGAAERGLLKDRSAASDDGLIRVRDWLGFAQDNVGKLSELSFGKEQRAIFQAGANNFPILKK
ncbi:MAG: caspase family protein [Planctomycetia bacterium]|nr:caspase family protein [Planctomycetia bacterium]